MENIEQLKQKKSISQQFYSKKVFLLIVIGLSLMLFVGLVGYKFFQEVKILTNCSNPIAQSLIKKEIRGESIQRCSVEEFMTSDNEKLFLIEISYGEGMDCPAGCIYNYKTYLLNDSGQTVKSFDLFYQTPNLSLGSSNQLCNYISSSHLGALLSSDPEHITRSLIKESNEYRWRFELNNFSGRPSGTDEFYARGKKCERTGVMTTDLDGKDVRVIGLPSFTLE